MSQILIQIKLCNLLLMLLIQIKLCNFLLMLFSNFSLILCLVAIWLIKLINMGAMRGYLFYHFRGIGSLFYHFRAIFKILAKFDNFFYNILMVENLKLRPKREYHNILNLYHQIHSIFF